MSVDGVGLSELTAALGPGVLLTDADLIESYRWDRAADPGAGRPVAVVRAESTAHVKATLEWAGRHRVPVVPRGCGTGLSGGATAVEECVVLSLERMRSIYVDPSARIVVAQPGAITADVKRAAAEHGLYYPPDPSSVDICSIGGNVATNAGGLCCVRYGVTSDYVLGMEVVLADGSVCRLGSSLSKDVAGLSLAKLFVGSEGTLGVITEVTLRLLPQPADVGTVVAEFASLGHAARAVVGITASLRPSMLELMDRTSVNAVEDRLRMGLDRSVGALLIAKADAGADLETLAQVCRDHGATEVFQTDDPDEGDLFVHVRRSALAALEAQGSVLLEDLGVPVARLPELVERIQATADDCRVTIAVIAHAGDGNTHPIIIFDPLDEAESRGAQAAFAALMELALELDGTITGEHGVGRLKRGWLASQLGDATMRLNWRVKQALDPRNILNPDAVFDPSLGL